MLSRSGIEMAMVQTVRWPMDRMGYDVAGQLGYQHIDVRDLASVRNAERVVQGIESIGTTQ